MRAQLDLVPAERRGRWGDLIDATEGRHPRDFEQANGWIVRAFQGALAAVSGAATPLDAIERAVRGGNDTDTVAAIAGSLAGAVWGADALPASHAEGLHGWPGIDGTELARRARQPWGLTPRQSEFATLNTVISTPTGTSTRRGDSDPDPHPSRQAALQPAPLRTHGCRQPRHRAIVAVPVGLGPRLRAHRGPDAREAPPDRGIVEVEPAGPVHDQHVVTHLDVEVARLVDQQRHEIGREDVERIALVAFRREEVEVRVEVAFERESLPPLRSVLER